tara:strand:+ start:28884 stop:29228 length:345 start_codon:yes stop_codon:yes gene_type:complete
MKNEDQQNQIQLSMQQAKDMLGKRDALRKLLENKEFDALINKGYFDGEAARLVALKADPEMQNERSQKAIDDQITAVGQFRLYLRTIFQQGQMAEKALADAEAEQAAILEQEAE